ncbi:MAG: bifunctional metallophosphatase/5'-nucleotidase [Prevotellaceae bacterium]|jgi:2',3'-cyclic-nucleotide 2'-phosphodiesterase (5'-nucleotidase family)|nr:bifunctional metallophosphatase/5'-nucleotidase [Prevotellaceae bacterium]
MKKLLFYLLVLFVSASCSTADKETQIIILSTNDMHAMIDDYAKVAEYVDKVRSENTNVLLLSGGDMFSGNPVVDRYADKGYPMIEIMNKIGYDYGVFGNHEFDYGQEFLAKRIKQANFPLLCANMKVSEQALIKQPQPYAMFNMDGIEICILSTIQVEDSNGKLIPSAHPDRVKNIDFFQPVETALEYKDLRKKCDLFISLNHDGIDEDIILAQKMPELDIIIGGHSHALVKGKTENGVLISQTECHLKYIGKTVITFKNKKITDKKFELVDVSTLHDENAEVKALISKYYEETPLNRVVGVAGSDFTGLENLGGLMTDAITKNLNLDIAFQNSGGIRTKKIEKGDISLLMLYKLDPFDNEVVLFEMTYDEIYSLLKKSYRSGSQYADLKTSGISYVIKVKNDEVADIEILDAKGNLLNKNKKYKVGINSYIASSYKFDHADAGKSLNVTSAEILIEYVKQQKEVYPQPDRTKIEKINDI